MINSEHALQIVLEQVETFGLEQVTLDQAYGRVLQEEIKADRDFPPFDRICMDGIAIKARTYLNGVRTFPIIGMQAAGSARLILNDEYACIEVATGAMLPLNTDSIIRYEDIIINNNKAVIPDNIKLKSNIHNQGADKKKGTLLLKKGTTISHAEIGVLSTVGQSLIRVSRLPKVAIITTGDELVDINETPEDFQIRKSNVFVLSSLLKNHQIQPTCYHIKDSDQDINNILKNIIDMYDIVLCSGAVSKGKFDFLPNALDVLGVKKLFHKVAQRPGKPFWFGKLNKKTIFAFPGNPVSTTVCFLKYCRPWLEYSIHSENKNCLVELVEDVHFNPPLTYFAQAKLINQSDARFRAKVSHGNGSGDLAHLINIDGFVELPQEKSVFKKGEVYPFIPLR